MKTVSTTIRARAITMIEVLMVVAALMILAAIFLPVMLRPKQATRSLRIQCVNNLKQIGLASRVWEGDNGDTFPMFVPETNGGTMEFTAGTNAWRHFQVMSNELSTPKLLICPAESDSNRFLATNFVWMNNSNLSYFVGIVTNDLNPLMILSGDHNITNGTPVKNGLLELTSRTPASWTAEVHNGVGNLAMVDGSVEQLNIAGLQNTVTATGLATNLLQMPILRP